MRLIDIRCVANENVQIIAFFNPFFIVTRRVTVETKMRPGDEFPMDDLDSPLAPNRMLSVEMHSEMVIVLLFDVLTGLEG